MGGISWKIGGSIGDAIGGTEQALGNIVEGVSKTGGDILEGVNKTTEAMADGFRSGVDSLIEANEDLAGHAGDALQNPLVQTVVSIINPTYGAILRTYTKINNGQDLSLADLAELGITSYTQLGGVPIDPAMTKALTASSRIVDGQDPMKVLVGTYGADFVKELDLAPKLTGSLSDTFGAETGKFVNDHMDLNQAAADLVAGESPARMVANQFGDEVAGYIGSGNPSMEALGYAGIKTSVLLSEGVDPSTALYRGANEYYDRGGQLPDLGKIGGMAGLDMNLPGLDANYQDFFSEIGKGIGDLVPEFGFGGLKDLGFDFGKVDLTGFDLNEDLLPEFGFEGLGEVGFDFGGQDLSGFQFDDFNGLTLPELEDMGIDPDRIDLSNMKIGLGALAGELALEELNKEEFQPNEDLLFGPRTTDNPLLVDNGPLLSRSVLERTL